MAFINFKKKLKFIKIDFNAKLEDKKPRKLSLKNSSSM